MSVQETETQKNEEEVLMKRLATEEPAHKQTHIEEPVHEDPRKVVGAAGIRRRLTYTGIEPNKRKFQIRKRKILPRNLRHRC